jgi:two-component sensor histidine kinase
VQHFASFVDLSKHKQEEDRLRFLLGELNHRTQNTLATVQAIAVQTLRGAANKEVVDAFEGRILALSKAHSLLGRKHWETVSLRDVIDQILQPFGLNDRRVAHFSVEGRRSPATESGVERRHAVPRTGDQCSEARRALERRRRKDRHCLAG